MRWSQRHLSVFLARHVRLGMCVRCFNGPRALLFNHVFHAIGGRLKLSSRNNFELPCRVLQNVLYKWCDAPHQSTGQKNHIEEIRDVTKLMQGSFV